MKTNVLALVSLYLVFSTYFLRQYFCKQNCTQKTLGNLSFCSLNTEENWSYFFHRNYLVIQCLAKKKLNSHNFTMFRENINSFSSLRILRSDCFVGCQNKPISGKCVYVIESV